MLGRGRTRRTWVVGFILVVSVAVMAASAPAATITPTSFGDDLAANGNCTLREAVRAANTDAAVDGCTGGAGTDRIVLDPGRYELSIAGRGEDNAATGDLDLTTDMEIRSSNTVDPPFGFVPHLSQPTIDANGIDRAFDVRSEATLDSMKIVGGSALGDGGGILVKADARPTSLLIHRSTVAGNAATGRGGGIAGDGTAISGRGVDVNRTTVAGNSASSGGGFALVGSLGNLNRSTVSGNAAVGAGGGVAVIQAPGTYGYSSIFVNSSTISGNVAGGNGGGIDANTTDPGGVGGALRGFLTVRRSTIADNRATGAGGGIRVNGTSGVNRSLIESIVADNDASIGPDCSGTVHSGDQAFGGPGYNLVETTAGCTILSLGRTDLTGVSPALFPLAANGGSTQTHAIKRRSPARDAGPTGSRCGDDQRSVPAYHYGGSACDIGAYELAKCEGRVITEAGPAGGGESFGAEFVFGRVDRIVGTSDSDSFVGEGGRDTLIGKGGKDSLCGDSDPDVLSGGNGKDKLDGSFGNDNLRGGRGNDRLEGGPRRDLLIGGPGFDRCIGGPDRDRARSCEVTRGVP